MFENTLKEKSENIVATQMQNFGETAQALANVKLPSIMRMHKGGSGTPTGADFMDPKKISSLKFRERRAYQGERGILQGNNEPFLMPAPVPKKSKKGSYINAAGLLISGKGN